MTIAIAFAALSTLALIGSIWVNVRQHRQYMESVEASEE
jgi:heme exporter protein D